VRGGWRGGGGKVGWTRGAIVFNGEQVFLESEKEAQRGYDTKRGFAEGDYSRTQSLIHTRHDDSQKGGDKRYTENRGRQSLKKRKDQKLVCQAYAKKKIYLNILGKKISEQKNQEC